MSVTVALLISTPRRDGKTLVAELAGSTLYKKQIHKVKDRHLEETVRLQRGHTYPTVKGPEVSPGLLGLRVLA